MSMDPYPDDLSQPYEGKLVPSTATGDCVLVTPKPCPVTPQELRDLADEIPWHPSIAQYVTDRSVQKMRARLRTLAQWLEQEGRR